MEDITPWYVLDDTVSIYIKTTDGYKNCDLCLDVEDSTSHNCDTYKERYSFYQQNHFLVFFLMKCQ